MCLRGLRSLLRWTEAILSWLSHRGDQMRPERELVQRAVTGRIPSNQKDTDAVGRSRGEGACHAALIGMGTQGIS